MSGNTLTTNSTLQCPHGGSVTISSSNSKAQANGGYIVTMNDTFTISGCPFQIPATPPIPSPCMKVQWLMADMSVQVGGQSSLSESSTGLCLSAQQVPQGPVTISPGQTRVSSK
jgi:hypothetical protein